MQGAARKDHRDHGTDAGARSTWGDCDVAVGKAISAPASYDAQGDIRQKSLRSDGMCIKCSLK